MYRITIEELKEKVWSENERRIVNERPYTDQELTEANSYFRNKQEMGETELKKVYEYVPIEKRKEEWSEVYQQLLDTLNVKAVILAALKGEQE